MPRHVAGEHAEINRRMAHKMNSYKKLVFSRGGATEPLAWNNAELVVTPTDDDLVRFVAELKTPARAATSISRAERSWRRRSCAWVSSTNTTCTSIP